MSKSGLQSVRLLVCLDMRGRLILFYDISC